MEKSENTSHGTQATFAKQAVHQKESNFSPDNGSSHRKGETSVQIHSEEIGKDIPVSTAK